MLRAIFVFVLLGIFSITSICFADASDGETIDPQVNRYWEALAGDGKSTTAAVTKLTEMGPRGAIELAKCVREMNRVDKAHVATLIAKLDAATFQDREAASDELRSMGQSVAPVLKRHLTTAESPEVKHRIDSLLADFQRKPVSPDDQARYRALYVVLEGIATRESMEVAVLVAQTAPTDEIREQYQRLANAQGRSLIRVHLASADVLESRELDGAIEEVSAAVAIARTVGDIAFQAIELRLASLTQRRQTGEIVTRLEAKLEEGGLSAGERLQLALQYIAELEQPERARRALADAGESDIQALLALAAPKDDGVGAKRLEDLAETAIRLSDRDSISPFARARLLAMGRDHLNQAAGRSEEDEERARLKTAAREIDNRLLALEPLASMAGAASQLRCLPAEAITENIVRYPEGRLTAPEGHEPYVAPTHWYTVGPLPTPKEDGQTVGPDPTSPPDLDQTFTSTENKPVQWRLGKHLPPTVLTQPTDRNCSYYGYTEIRWPRTEAVAMTFGCDDAATVWVNGRKAWQSEPGPRSWSPDLGTKTVTLNRGLNRILFRLDNMGGAMGMSVAIAGPAGD